MGYSPWGHKQADRTERLHFTSLLQCMCSSLVSDLPLSATFPFHNHKFVCRICKFASVL